MKRILYFSTICILLALTACEERETEYGNSKIYFTNTAPKVVFLDKITMSEISAIPDTVIHYVTIYRSGIVDHLERIDITLSMDNESVRKLIQDAKNTDPLYQTDLMKQYVNSMSGQDEMFSFPAQVSIPKGERKVVLPVTLKRSLIYQYENDYLNYTLDEYQSTSITKDRMLVLGIRITITSAYELLDESAFCYLEIIKAITID